MSSAETIDPTLVDVHLLLMQRASVGSFAPADVGCHQITQLLQAARLAPSSHNTQPWRFIVVQDGPDRDAIDDDLIEWGAPWAVQAPVLIAVTTDLAQGTAYHGINYALLDCGMAVENILLQASSMGLAAHPVGYKDRERIHRALHLPPEQTLLMFVAVGYPGGEAVETNSRRRRKPLAAIATLDHWDGPPIDEQLADAPMAQDNGKLLS